MLLFSGRRSLPTRIYFGTDPDTKLSRIEKANTKRMTEENGVLCVFRDIEEGFFKLTAERQLNTIYALVEEMGKDITTNRKNATPKQ